MDGSLSAGAAAVPLDPLAVAADITEIHAAGVFDGDWYEARYRDLGWPPGGGLVHYCALGWRQGLQPSLYFDADHYRDACGAVAPFGMNPLLHYVRHGEAAGCRPSQHFDPAWYRQRHALVPDRSCLGHYLCHRRSHTHSPNPTFDAAFYAAQNHDVAASGRDLFEHYVLYGAKEGRAPSRDGATLRDVAVIRASGLFDPAYYLDAYPHVRHGGIDPLLHFCERGWRDGRYNPNPLFDTALYLAANRDVAASGCNPLLHYIEHGEAEDRAPCPRFDPASYRRGRTIPDGRSCLRHHLDAIAAAGPDPGRDREAIRASGLFEINHYLISYPDVRASTVDPLEHFCSVGWREGRRPNPYFDPAWYAAAYMPGDDATNPLLHYLRTGERCLNRPIVYFDPDWYGMRYGPPGDGTLLKHFLGVRRRQEHSPVPAFDVDWYVAGNGAEIGRNRDPFAHYLREAISRDLDPGPSFDAGAYRRAHMDAPVPSWQAASGAEIHERIRREAFNPLVHCLLRAFSRGDASRPEDGRRPSSTGADA